MNEDFIIICGDLKKYNGNDTDIIIPDKVINIDSFAFSRCSSLKSIVIPDSVEYIGDCAFYECSSLTGIKIPDRVDHIGDGAFSGCCSLEHIEIPGSVDYIGKYAFYGCCNLKNVDIPDSIDCINDATFYGCSSLKSLAIPDSVESIGSCALYGCSSLGKIDIPENISAIEWDAFLYCKNLEIINVFADVSVFYFDWNDYIFEGCDNLKFIIQCGCLNYCPSDDAIITVPGDVWGIDEDVFLYHENLEIINILADEEDFYFDPDEYDFDGCDNLRLVIQNGQLIRNFSDDRTITIPNDVVSIGNCAFADCDNLENIVIPESVRSIGESAFAGCTNLTHITIPEGVESIEEETFAYCESLESIVIPKSVRSIANDAFMGCSSLETINVLAVEDDFWFFPDDYDFEGCDNLKFLIQNEELIKCYADDEIITVPDGVTCLGNWAFYNLPKVKQIYFPESVIEVFGDSMVDCEQLEIIHIPNKDLRTSPYPECPNIKYHLCGDVLVECFNPKKVAECILDEGIKAISQWAFFTCHFKSIILPEGLETIDEDAFRECDELEFISIPSTVKEIPAYTFSDCEKLDKECLKGWDESVWQEQEESYICANPGPYKTIDHISHYETLRKHDCVPL